MIVNIDKKIKLSIILTKLTAHKTTTTFDISNPGPGLRQSQKGGGGIL